MRSELFLKKISIGKKCEFFGRSIFVRHPLSQITIGNKCRFRSDFTSNLVGINRRCIISTAAKNASIKIGNNCGFSGTVIVASKKIEIEDNVLMGANTLITDYDWHNISTSERHQKCTSYAPVKVEKNVWLGLNVIVLKGVTIGKNSVIGANSVVVKDIPENSVAAGNPCKVIRRTDIKEPE